MESECTVYKVLVQNGVSGLAFDSVQSAHCTVFFPDPMRAHRELDAAVEAACGADFNDDECLIAHLFKRPADKVGQ